MHDWIIETRVFTEEFRGLTAVQGGYRDPSRRGANAGNTTVFNRLTKFSNPAPALIHNGRDITGEHSAAAASAARCGRSRFSQSSRICRCATMVAPCAAHELGCGKDCRPQKTVDACRDLSETVTFS
jgi:ABC-type branched-subunit amino acid transport system ATPase component